MPKSRWLLIAALLMSSPAWGTPVPASLSSDTVWHAGSVYTVAETATVAAGVTLTIEPGVEVQLATGQSLIIEGTLIARGAVAKPIVFTGLVEGAEPTRWGSVVFEDGSTDATYEHLDDFVTGSILEHCVLEHATKAVRLHGASPAIYDNVFRHNTSPPTPDIAGGAGIYVGPGSAPRIARNTFLNNEAALVAYGGAIFATDAHPIIQDNIFRENRSVYGGALATDLVASPIVGNHFEANDAVATKGGAVALVSGISAFLNNTVIGNFSKLDGAGVHICVDCYPHATPFVMDNVITGNIAANESVLKGSAGFGAAFLRVFSHNDIYDNLRDGQPSDFGWYHHESEGYPAWVADRSIANNFWGRTDEAFLAETIFDGDDAEGYHHVSALPAAAEPVAAPRTRVTITTRKLRYEDAGDDMPVFLTIYNPGPARSVRLSLSVAYEGGASLPYSGALDFPDAQRDAGGYVLELPANATFFTTLITPIYAYGSRLSFGHWHAALFERSGARIGDVSTIRFDLDDPGGSHAPIATAADADTVVAPPRRTTGAPSLSRLGLGARSSSQQVRYFRRRHLVESEASK